MRRNSSRLMHERRRRSLRVEQLESRQLLAANWRNPLDYLDANNDQKITPLDALAIINELNRNGGAISLSSAYTSGSLFIDVNGDGQGTPVDALIIINELNRGTSGVRALNDADQSIHEKSTIITVGAATGRRTFKLQIEGAVGTSHSNSTLANDLLAVYLLDPNDSTKSLVGDLSIPPQPIFLWAGSHARTLPGVSNWDGQTLELDLTKVNYGDTGRLLFQLIDRNTLQDTELTFNLLENSVDPTAISTSIPIPPQPLAQLGGAIDASNFEIVTDVQIIEHFAYVDRTKNTFTTRLIISNPATPLSKSTIIEFPDLPPGVQLTNGSGLTDTGVPYLNISPTLPAGGLLPGTVSETFEASFTLPASTPLHLNPIVKTGLANQPPMIDELPSIRMHPGETKVIPFVTTDADGVAVTLALNSMSTMKGELGPSSNIVLRPTILDIGAHVLTLVASDGPKTSRRELQVEVVADEVTTTRVSGQLVDEMDNPLGSVLIELDGASVLTDSTGRFVLEIDDTPASPTWLTIRGDLIGEASKYSRAQYPLSLLLPQSVTSHANNVLAHPIRLFPSSPGTAVNPTLDSIVTVSALPHAAITIPANSAKATDGTLFNGELSLITISPRHTPLPLPMSLAPDIIFAVEPSSVTFTIPAPLSSPNLAGWAPNTVLDLWSISPITGQFEIVGRGMVSSDGTAISTVEGGVRSGGIQFFAISAIQTNLLEISTATASIAPSQFEIASSDLHEIDLFSGTVLKQYELQGYASDFEAPVIRLVYDSQRVSPQSIVRGQYSPTSPTGDLITRIEVSDGSFSYIVPGYTKTNEDEISFPELHGGERFFRSSSSNDETIQFASQLDLSTFDSGAYDLKLSIGHSKNWTESVCHAEMHAINDPSNCDAPLTPIDRVAYSTTDISQQLTVVNETASPVGAGWGIAGLLKLIESPNGSVLLIDGNGSESLFYPPPVPNGTYQAPDNFTSTLTRQTDGSFTLYRTDHTLLTFNSGHLLETVTAIDGKRTSYAYNPDGTLESITDHDGGRTELQYSNGHLSTITDPSGQSTQILHDSRGNLTKITNPDGSSRNFTYNSLHQLFSEQDDQGHTSYTLFDAHGLAKYAVPPDRQLIEIHSLNNINDFSLNNGYSPLAPAQSHGNEFNTAISHASDGSFQYLSVNTPDRSESWIDSERTLLTVKQDEQKTVVLQQDSNGHRTQNIYNKHGNLTGSWDSLSNVTSGTLPGRHDTITYTVRVDHAQLFYLDTLDSGDINFKLASATETYLDITAGSEWTQPIPFLLPGEYFITLTSTSDTPQFYRFTARTLDDADILHLGTTVSSSISQEAILYRVGAEPGDVFEIIRTDNARDVYVRVYDGAGQLVTDRNSGGISQLKQPRDGQLYLVVERISVNDSSNAAQFSITTRLTGHEEYAPYEGIPIELNKPVTATLEKPRSITSYVFTLDHPASITLLPDSSWTYGIKWILRGPYGYVFPLGSAISSSHFVRADAHLSAGQYQLQLYSEDQPLLSTFPLSFTFRVDSDSSLKWLTSEQITSGVMFASDLHRYSFIATFGQQFSFNYSEPTPNQPISVYLSSPTGKPVALQTSDTNNWAYLTEAGPYTVILRRRDTSPLATAYSLSYGNEVHSNYESVNIGSQTLGSLTLSDPMKTYHFRLSEPTPLHFSLWDNNSGTRWRLVGPEGLVFDNEADDGVPWHAINHLYHSPPGDYHLTFYPSYSNSGRPFTFRIDDTRNAPPLPLQSQINLPLGRNATVAQSINLLDGQQLVIDFDSQIPDYTIQWELIDPLGNIQQTTLGGAGLRFTALQSGAYTLFTTQKEFSDSIPNQIQFHAYVLNEALPAEVALGQRITAEIEIPGQTRSYTFTLDDESSLHIDTRALDSDPQNYYWELSASNRLLHRESFSNTGISSYALSTLLRQAPGQYTLTVGNSAFETGRIEVTLRDFSQAESVAPGITNEINVSAHEASLFQFEVPVESRFFFDALSNIAPESARWKLLSSSGSFVFDSDFTNQGLHTLSPGTYRLIIQRADTATLNQPIAFKIVEIAPPPVLPLTLGEVTTNRIELPQDYVQYTFSMDTSTQLIFDDIPNQATDPFLSWTLRDVASPQTPISSRTSVTSETHEETLLPPGSYTLKIWGSNTFTGEFSFRLAEPRQLPSLPFDIPTSVNLPQNTRQEFQLALEAGHAYYLHFDATYSEKLYTQLRVFDFEGNTLVNLTADSLRSFTPTKSGNYVVLIYRQSYPISVFDFTITAKELGPITTIPLELDTLYSDFLQYPGDVAVYTFQLESSARLMLDTGVVALHKNHVRWTLRNTSESLFDSSFTLPEDRGPIWAPAGLYTLTLLLEDQPLVANEPVAVDYEFRIIDLLTAETLTPGTPIQGHLPARQIVAYQFEAHPGDVLDFSSVALESPETASWLVVDPYRQYSILTSASPTSTLAIEDGGTYVLLLTGNSDATTGTDFTANILHTEGTTPPPLPGRPIHLDTRITGSLTTSSQTDYYTFTLTQSSNLYLDYIKGPSSARFEIQGPFGIRIFIDERRFLPNSSTLSQLANLPAGEYQISLRTSFSTPVEYDFRLLNLSAAPIADLGIPVTGTIADSQTNAYRLNAVGGTRISLRDLSASALLPSSLRLINRSGYILRASTLPEEPLFDIPYSDEYILLFEREYGLNDISEYAFRLDIVGLPPTFPIEVGTHVTGEISTPHDFAKYSFELTEDKHLFIQQFNQFTATNSIQFKIENAAGDVIAASSMHWLNPSTFEALNLPAGQYTITIYSSSNYTGSFAFRLLDGANGPSVNFDSPISGDFISERMHAYTLDGEKDQSFWIAPTNQPDQPSPQWVLIDPQGNLVHRNPGTDVIRLSAAGKYIFILYPAASTPTNVNYSFQVKSLPNRTPSPIGLNQLASGTMRAKGDSQTYTFEVTEPSFPFPDFLSQSNPIQTFHWYISTPDGWTFSGHSGDGPPATMLAYLRPMPGLFTLTVRYDSGPVGDFQFELIDFYSSPAVGTNELINANLPARATRGYQFSASKGQRIYIDFPDTSQINSVKWYLIDRIGNEVAEMPFPESSVLDLPSDGEYYLIFKSNDNATTAVELDFTVRTLDSVSITPIQPGAPVFGSIDAPGDLRKYSFTVKQSTDFYLVLNNPNSLAQFLSWELRDISGNVVFPQPFRVPLLPQTIQDQKLPPGNYTLSIMSTTEARSDFSFLLREITHVGPVPLDWTASAVQRHSVDLAFDEFFS